MTPGPPRQGPAWPGGGPGIRSTVSAGHGPWNPEHCECRGWPEKGRKAKRPEKDREDCYYSFQVFKSSNVQIEHQCAGCSGIAVSL